MPLYEVYLRGSVRVKEFTEVNLQEIRRARGSQRRIQPGMQKDITPMARQLSENFAIWGCTYEIIAHDDPFQTGALRMIANSSFGWDLVWRPEDGKIVPVIGSHVFPMGPDSRDLFIFARRTKKAVVIDKLLEWRIPRRGSF